MTLGERLYQLRIEHKLTLRALAHQIGRTHASVSFIERDRNGAFLNTLVSIANVYGMTVQELIAPVDFGEQVRQYFVDSKRP